MEKVKKIILWVFLISILIIQPVFGQEEKVNPNQLRELITEVLLELNLYSANACELLMLTAAQESHLGHYIRQVGNDPARGIFQMEPATEEDIWKNFLKFKPQLSQTIMALWGEANSHYMQLAGNFLYQIAMARLQYYRRPEALPDHKNVIAMAQYWKAHYNRCLGKGTWQEAIKNYIRLAKPGQ